MNLNIEIVDLLLKIDGTKLAYIERQDMTGQTIHTANINGANDAIVYTTLANTATVSTQIKYLKYGSPKIYFATATQTNTDPTSSIVTKMNTINFDGTGLVSENALFGGSDMTNDRKYIVQKA